MSVVKKRPNNKSLIALLLAELDQEINVTKDGEKTKRISKAQALVKTIIDQAISGELCHINSALKFIQSLEHFRSARKSHNRENRQADYENIFRYSNRRKPLKNDNPLQKEQSLFPTR